MIYNQGFGGGMKPKIIVTAPTGTAVTATKGTTVIVAGEAGGKYVILADDYGVWTVAGTKGSQSVSQDVNVVAVDTYEVTLDFTPKVLNDATWEQIRDVADASTGPNYWSVGDTKQITMNGKVSDGLTLSNYNTWVYIIGFDHNKDIEGTGIVFQGFKTAQTGGVDVALCDSGYASVKSSGQWFSMNNSRSNAGGWASSLMRTATIPVVKSAMPTELTSVVKSTTIYTDNTGGGSQEASYVTATQDGFYLLSEFEVFGVRTYANQYEQNYQQQYAYYSAGNSKIKYRYDGMTDAVVWWERSVAWNYSYGFCYVNANGGSNDTDAQRSYGLAPAFKVGSNPPPQPISALAVGSSVFCNVNGIKTEFIIVNQGNPYESLYDNSCNGAWVMMKDLYTTKEIGSTNTYSTSSINTYLNGEFLNKFDTGVQNTIVQVKVPYCSDPSNRVVKSGADGAPAKVFLLSAREIVLLPSDFSNSTTDGSKLDYFVAGSAGNSKRIANYNGAATIWWTRSVATGSLYNEWFVFESGWFGNTSTKEVHGIRPAFILPLDTQVDFQGNIVI